MNGIAIHQLPPSALLLGSGLIALGASILVGAALMWLRRPRRTVVEGPYAATVVDLVDEDAPPVVESMAPELRHIDSRLDDLETCLATLTERVDSLLRQRSEPELRSTRVSAVEHGVDTPSAEFEMLRELAARNQ
jgi:hypothetical protein